MPPSTNPNRPAIGAHRPETDDAKYGRWWRDHYTKRGAMVPEHRRPVLYSPIVRGSLYVCQKPLFLRRLFSAQ
jgi:hypothetical protein